MLDEILSKKGAAESHETSVDGVREEIRKGKGVPSFVR